MKSYETPLLADFLDFDIYPHLSQDNSLNLIHNGNAKNMLIVINDSDLNNIEFLSKILKAIQFDIEKDVILWALPPKKMFNLTHLRKNTPNSIDKILLFDVLPERLSLQFKLPIYFITKINDTTFLSSDSLSSISKNQAKKKQLWEALQQLFGVK